jgi:type VI secretion system protein ImpE
MTETAKDRFDAGDLAGAIATATAAVKARPTDIEARVMLADLLAFAGEIERADRQLDAAVAQDPTVAVGVALTRQLLRAEQARREVFRDGRLPELLGAASPLVEAHLRALAALRAGDAAEAALLLEATEAARKPLPGRHGGEAFDDFRDLDDLLASVFEVLTSTGKYYWVAAETVVSATFHSPVRIRDLLWRRVTLVVADGPDGDVYLPSVYPETGAVADRTRLGRVTEWSGGDGSPVRGHGQRCWLAGDRDLPILTATTLDFAP